MESALRQAGAVEVAMKQLCDRGPIKGEGHANSLQHRCEDHICSHPPHNGDMGTCDEYPIQSASENDGTPATVTLRLVPEPAAHSARHRLVRLRGTQIHPHGS